MNVLLALLAGYVLLSRPDAANAQMMTAQRQRINDLFTTVDPAPAQAHKPAAAEPGGLNKEQLRICCERIARDGQRLWFVTGRNGKIRLQVRGIYVRGSALFLALRLTNRSPLDFEIDSIRFSIIEKGNKLGSGVEPDRLSPLYTYNGAATVRSDGRVTTVMVLPRISLAGRERLLIEVHERKGGRQLQVLASHFILANARLI